MLTIHEAKSETNGKRKFGKKAECLNDDRVLGRRNKVKTKMGQRYEGMY